MMSEERQYPTSRQEFYDVIYEYYLSNTQGLLAENVLKELVNTVTDYEYSQYRRFYAQYPKSAKRYSKLDAKDLDHTFVLELIVNFFKKKDIRTYQDNAMVVLKMTSAQLSEFEKRQREFYEMF